VSGYPFEEGKEIPVRIATLAIVAAALASGSGALAIGPPRPPQPPPAPPQPLPASGTGLIGYVSRGPVSPVCRVGVPCFRPAQVILRFGRRQAVAVRVSTRPTGVYRVVLKPGTYTVSVAGAGRLGRLRPSVVTVPASGWKRVNFVLSTGIY
jgi:hypothetical protein